MPDAEFDYRLQQQVEYVDKTITIALIIIVLIDVCSRV
jgi:hypothetical protein